jgi:hypothetical protein
MTMRDLTEIIVHCAATRPEWMDNRPIEDKVAEIRSWHVDGNGWSDIGYHWIIDRDGSKAPGRAMDRDGAHVRGHNRGTVGICLIGGFGSSENDSPHDHYTPSQLASLRMLIGDLQVDHPGIKKVSGHNEYAAKACPGFQVTPWLADKPERTSPAQSTTIRATATAAAAGLGGVGTAIGKLDGTAQIVLIVCAFVGAGALAWIARERLKKWARGVR